MTDSGEGSELSITLAIVSAKFQKFQSLEALPLLEDKKDLCFKVKSFSECIGL